MSKKNRNKLFNFGSSAQTESQPVSGHLSAEYRIIRHDLVRVVLLNGIFLVGVLLLYFTNQKSEFLEHWFQKLMH